MKPRDLVGGLIVVLAAAGRAMASEPQAEQPAGATAAPSPAPAIRRAEPIFKVMKEYQDLGAPGPFYPERAVQLGLQGGAAVECVLIETGELTKCRVLVEKPPGAGFGDAALAMAQKHWMTAKPMIVDGQPLKQETVDVLVPFLPRRP